MNEPLGGVGQSMLGDLAARVSAADALLELADRADAQRAVVAARVEPVRVAAEMLHSDGDRGTAAKLYEFVARQYRRAYFIAAAEDYERRARECRARRRTGK